MNFEGMYNACLPVGRLPSRPILDEGTKSIVLDVDGVLLLQKPAYRNGIRIADRHELNPQAEEAIRKVQRRFPQFILWSSSPKSLYFFELISNRRFPQIISGFHIDYETGLPSKPLGIVSRNLRDVVAIEDHYGDVLTGDFINFAPPERVIRFNPNRDCLLEKFEEACRMVEI